MSFLIPMPKRYAYNGQAFVTEFVRIGLPLFPYNTYYKVSDNIRFPVETKNIDIYDAYSKVHFGIFGVLGLVISTIILEVFFGLAIFLLIFSIVILIGFFKSWVDNAHDNESEILDREIFQRSFFYNMPPEYLPNSVQLVLFEKLLSTYENKYNHVKWQDEIINLNINVDNFPLLYTLAYYTKVINPEEKNMGLYKIILPFKDDKNIFDPTAENKQYIQVSKPQNCTVVIESTSQIKFNFDNKVENKEVVEQEVDIPYKEEFFPLTTKDKTKLNKAKSKDLEMIYILLAVWGGLVLILSVITFSFFLPFIIVSAIIAIIGIPFLFIVVPRIMDINLDLKMKQKIKISAKINDFKIENGGRTLYFKNEDREIKSIWTADVKKPNEVLNKQVELYIAPNSGVSLEIISTNL